MTEQYRLDRPVALTCPECGGALRAEEDGGLLQYRCHIGHILTAETMLAAQFLVLETKLAACLVELKERAELCRQMAEHTPDAGYTIALEAAGQEAYERALLVKNLLESEWLTPGRVHARQRQSGHA